MTAREVLDALADELEIPFLCRPFEDGAFLEHVIEGMRDRMHDESDCIAIAAAFGEFA